MDRSRSPKTIPLHMNKRYANFNHQAVSNRIDYIQVPDTNSSSFSLYKNVDVQLKHQLVSCLRPDRCSTKMFFLIALVVLLPTVVFSQTPDQCTLINSASTFTGRVTFTGYYFNSNTSATLSVKVINSGQTIAITGSVPSVGTLNITGPVYGYAASLSGGKLALWIGGLQGSSIGSTTISGTSQGTVTGVSLITGTTTSAKALNINGISYLNSNGFHEEVVIAGTLSSALKFSCSYSG